MIKKKEGIMDKKTRKPEEIESNQNARQGKDEKVKNHLSIEGKKK